MQEVIDADTLVSESEATWGATRQELYGHFGGNYFRHRRAATVARPRRPAVEREDQPPVGFPLVAARVGLVVTRMMRFVARWWINRFPSCVCRICIKIPAYIFP